MFIASEWQSKAFHALTSRIKELEYLLGMDITDTEEPLIKAQISILRETYKDLFGSDYKAGKDANAA